MTSYINKVILSHPVPLFNTPHIEMYFGRGERYGLKLDSQNLLRATECIALPGMTLTVLREVAPYIVEVLWSAEPSNEFFYTDKRFLDQKEDLVPTIPLERSPEGIINALRAMQGTSYIWGGNWSAGIPEMLQCYLPPGELDEEHKKLWTLQGVDCSGLLFEVIGGKTPRNTSQLVDFGRVVSIEKDSMHSIIDKLEPLDLIVWKGHVLIALNRDEIIESRAGDGVVISSSEEAVEKILKERIPVNFYPKDGMTKTFVIRRGVKELL